MGGGQQSQWDEQDLTGASSGWPEVFATAVAPAMVLIWLVSLFAEPVSPAAGLGLYAAVLAALLPALRPWAARRD